MRDHPCRRQRARVERDLVEQTVEVREGLRRRLAEDEGAGVGEAAWKRACGRATEPVDPDREADVAVEDHHDVVPGMGDPGTGVLDAGEQDFSVEAWVRSTANGERVIAAKRGSSGSYWRVTISDESGSVGFMRANAAVDADRGAVGGHAGCAVEDVKVAAAAGVVPEGPESIVV
jgi:hypothetical protein